MLKLSTRNYLDRSTGRNTLTLHTVACLWAPDEHAPLSKEPCSLQPNQADPAADPAADPVAPQPDLSVPIHSVLSPDPHLNCSTSPHQVEHADPIQSISLRMTRSTITGSKAHLVVPLVNGRVPPKGASKENPPSPIQSSRSLKHKIASIP